MPVYNSETYLPLTLNSLINQKYSNWELIAVDDKSSDSSVKILKEFSKKDQRIKLIEKEKNSGSADSRNKAIEIANGKYITFLDSDDLWDENFLIEMIAFMNSKKSIFSFSSYRFVDENGEEIIKPFIIKEKEYKYLDILFHNKVGLLTAIYDSEKCGKMYFNTSLKSLRDDYALWLDILKKEKVAFGNSKVLASYRIRKNALTANKKKVILAHYRMLRTHLGLNPFSAFFFTITHSLNGVFKYYR
ncbi:MAG: glycosyltransferase family 2 protein [Leptospiraceae bacterium]|nr:glycosyltransferase family 2 protein [Leptospiraceae bacterium]